MLVSGKKPSFSSLIELDSGAIMAGAEPPTDAQTSSTSGTQATFLSDGYKSVWDISSVRALLHKAVDEYNKVYPRIKLSLYDSTIRHICRIGM